MKPRSSLNSNMLPLFFRCLMSRKRVLEMLTFSVTTGQRRRASFSTTFKHQIEKVAHAKMIRFQTRSEVVIWRISTTSNNILPLNEYLYQPYCQFFFKYVRTLRVEWSGWTQSKLWRNLWSSNDMFDWILYYVYSRYIHRSATPRCRSKSKAMSQRDATQYIWRIMWSKDSSRWLYPLLAVTHGTPMASHEFLPGNSPAVLSHHAKQDSLSNCYQQSGIRWLGCDIALWTKIGLCRF